MKLKTIFRQIISERSFNFDDIKITDVISNTKILADPIKNRLFNTLKNIIKNHIDNDSIDLWREMTVSDKWVDSIFGNSRNITLGKYWAYDKDSAYSYWGKGDIKVLIGVRAQLNQVDWEYTFKVKLQNDPEDLEKEIGLLDGEIVKVGYLEIDGNVIDINDLDSNEFKI